MRWEPDTCSCIFICRLDDDGINLDWTSTENTCDAHKTFTGQALLDQVLQENRYKNITAGS